MRYSDQLLDPRWQRKRLEILERDQFACTNCGATEKTLHVHHTYYERDLMPWEYPDESLETLCVDCHKRVQELMTLLHRQFGRIGQTNIQVLYGFALGLETQEYPMVVLHVPNYEVAEGVARCWELTAEEVIAALKDQKIDGYGLDALVKAKQGDDECVCRTQRCGHTAAQHHNGVCEVCNAGLCWC